MFAVDHGGICWFGYDVDARTGSAPAFSPSLRPGSSVGPSRPAREPSSGRAAQNAPGYASGHGILP
jgi:hypothetical protein